MWSKTFATRKLATVKKDSIPVATRIIVQTRSRKKKWSWSFGWRMVPDNFLAPDSLDSPAPSSDRDAVDREEYELTIFEDSASEKEYLPSTAPSLRFGMLSVAFCKDEMSA